MVVGVNLAAFPRERRPCMTPRELVNLYGCWPCAPEAIAPLGETFDELLDADELAGLVCDASELAGRLDLSAPVRRLAACVAACGESALVRGLAGWDHVVSVLEAGESLRKSMKASA